MKKKAVFLSFFFFAFLSAFAQQEAIQAQSVFKFVSPEEFTNEYQYLSSEVFLFNAAKFTNLVNEVNKPQKKKRRKNAEQIQQVMITAKVDNLKFFNKSLSYPIYSFQVSKGKDDKYKVNSGTQAELIRLFENLPLATVGSGIDLSVKGTIITNKNANKVMEYIGGQLQNMAEVPTGTSLIFSLVNEFGKFIVSRSQGKQFEFSSTVRMYEDQDFNRKMHSVYVFVFAPESKTNLFFEGTKLNKYLNNPNLLSADRKSLQSALNYHRYPYLVVVNYKSKYESKAVVGDHITKQKIIQRREKNRNAHETKLIDDHTYVLEQKLSDFLEVFSEFKNLVSNYQLNFTNKITDDFSKNLFLILKQYRKLLKLAEINTIENEHDALFMNQFRKQYDAILTSSDLYLEKDRNLKNLKLFSQKISELESINKYEAQKNQAENDLLILRGVQIPNTESNTDEYILQNKWLENIENHQYKMFYEQQIDLLMNGSKTSNLMNLRSELLKSIKSTNCELCKQKANIAITAFDDFQHKVAFEKAREKMFTEWQATKNFQYNWLKNMNCIETNLAQNYPDSISQPEHINLLKQEFMSLNKLSSTMTNLIDKRNFIKEIEEIDQYITDLRRMEIQLSQAKKTFCDKQEDICTCK